jgi:hypothetical protein
VYGAFNTTLVYGPLNHINVWALKTTLVFGPLKPY